MPQAKQGLNELLHEIRRIEQSREILTEKKIRKIYKQLLKELNHFLADEYVRYSKEGKLTVAMLQEKSLYAKFLEEIEANINNLTPEIAELIRKTVEDTYTGCYKGMSDAVLNAENTKSALKYLKNLNVRPEVMKRAIENPISGLTLPDILERNRREVIYDIKQQINISLMNGDRYETTARKIAEKLDMSYAKATNIVRTETHRVTESGFMDGAKDISEALEETGFVYTAVWRTMKDERVRPQQRYHTRSGWKTSKSKNGANHQKMEGAIIQAGGSFELEPGVYAECPGASGTARNDCRCRCFLEYELMSAEEFAEKSGRSIEKVRKKVEKEFTKGDSCGIINTDDIDYMSNSFRPKYGKETIDKVGKIKIPVKKVENSQFEIYTDIENTPKNKAVRLTEKNMRNVANQLPKDFEMPKIVVIDFDKYNLNTDAIGGYRKETNTMYINSKYDTPEKITAYINKTKGYFSNNTEVAPYLHELGHKQYEDTLVKYAEKNNVSVDKARYIVENKLMEYVSEKRKDDLEFIKHSISGYAEKSYSKHKYSELFAECFSAEFSNDCIENTLKIIDLKR